jgi:hypothetical protein
MSTLCIILVVKRWILGSWLVLAAFGLYVHGAYPSVSVGDSGEFITAGATLGIPHAPGFPTYVLLAKCVQTVLPWANAAYRINLFSSICGALTVGLVFWIGLQLPLPVPMALLAALLFMVGQAQRVNAQASEVFALHALFSTAVLSSLIGHQWLLAAFLGGLGMGNHQTVLFLMPAVITVYWMSPPESRTPLLPLSAAFLAGLSVYLILLVRAGQNPSLNGGNPETLERLWRVFTRADYGSLTLAIGETPARTPGFTWMNIERFSRGFVSQLTWAGVVGGGVGLFWAWKKRLTPAIALAVAWLFIGPGFFLLGNLPFNAQSEGLLERFYIVPTLCWTLLFATGISFLATRQRWIGILAFAVPLLLILQPAKAFPLRSDFRAYAYGHNNLRTLPSQTMFIMDGGDDTFYTLA